MEVMVFLSNSDPFYDRERGGTRPLPLEKIGPIVGIRFLLVKDEAFFLRLRVVATGVFKMGGPGSLFPSFACRREEGPCHSKAQPKNGP